MYNVKHDTAYIIIIVLSPNEGQWLALFANHDGDVTWWRVHLSRKTARKERIICRGWEGGISFATSIGSDTAIQRQYNGVILYKKDLKYEVKLQDFCPKSQTTKVICGKIRWKVKEIMSKYIFLQQLSWSRALSQWCYSNWKPASLCCSHADDKKDAHCETVTKLVLFWLLPPACEGCGNLKFFSLLCLFTGTLPQFIAVAQTLTTMCRLGVPLDSTGKNPLETDHSSVTARKPRLIAEVTSAGEWMSINPIIG